MFGEIQDGGWRPFEKKSNGHITRINYPIHLMYAYHTLPSDTIVLYCIV